MSKIEIIDNSISLVDQSRIETLFSDKFTGWYYDEYTVSSAKNYRPQMVHSVFHHEEGILSESFHLLYEVFSRVMPEWDDEKYSLSRIKANMNFQHSNKSVCSSIRSRAMPSCSCLSDVHVCQHLADSGIYKFVSRIRVES